ncbi:conserved hypothetical protein [Ricinus communis]|uniref:Uncharacterized protein n=1 Tax=Ricinus communis TaxID=3988 RepID=B9SMI8_RICCO|nr:conserved hypothetical protein [Ricinus communis]
MTLETDAREDLDSEAKTLHFGSSQCLNYVLKCYDELDKLIEPPLPTSDNSRWSLPS